MMNGQYDGVAQEETRAMILMVVVVQAEWVYADIIWTLTSKEDRYDTTIDTQQAFNKTAIHVQQVVLYISPCNTQN